MYDNKIYPGQITDIDHEGVLVSALQSKGDNKFVTPANRDEIWYAYDATLSYIDEPVKFSARSRYVSVESNMWSKLVGEIRGGK